MRDYRCSFCGKRQDQVKKLVAGPDHAYICDGCVTLCAEIMRDEVGPPAPSGGAFRAEERPVRRRWRIRWPWDLSAGPVS